MTNYFILNGKLLDTDMSAEEIESRVSESLDDTTSGMAQFRIKRLSEKEVRFFFVRDFRCDPNKHIIYDADMALITGLGIGAFKPQTVGGYPMIYPLNFAGKNFYTDITAFIRLYKMLLYVGAGEQQIEYIGLRTYSDRILMQIIF